VSPAKIVGSQLHCSLLLSMLLLPLPLPLLLLHFLFDLLLKQ